MEHIEEHNYKILSDGLAHYMNLWNNGLKKQANLYIKNFIHTLKTTLDKNSLDIILERFCRELCDGKQYNGLMERGNGSLPHELNELVWAYLKENCNAGRMPHMRWLYQLYNRKYNPFNPQSEIDTCLILKRAYEHEQCDQKTVNLYLQAQFDILGWGAHHFPDCCIITKQTYIDTIKEAERITQEHFVNDALIEELHNWIALYQCYYQFEDNGKKGDFRELCHQAGIDF